MDTFDFGRLIYLVLMGGVIAAYFFVQNRHRLGQMAQQAAIWALIFLGAIIAVGLWDDVRTTLQPQQTVFSEAGRIEVPRAPDGHYYLSLRVNGEPVRFIVDTGASDIVLSLDDARRIGIPPEDLRFIGIASTANGQVQTANIRLDRIEIGGITDRNIRASVSQGDMPGSLLGMGYLSRFSSLSIEDNRLTLIR